MNLSKAFSISSKNNEMIAFVGGGGKTSAIFRLARELKSLGKKVLITTTTAIYVPDPSLYDYLYLGNGIPVEKLIGNHSITVMGQEITPQNKLKGFSPETVDQFMECGVFDMILVEADGSKSRPIKAPNAHEPVIPLQTSVMIGVIGFDCYGKPLDSEWVHRPEILADIVGKTIGDVIDDGVIKHLITAPNGLFKNCPADARKIVLFNKVLSQENFDEDETIGKFIRNGEQSIDAVVIGAVQEEPPVRCVILMR